MVRPKASGSKKPKRTGGVDFKVSDIFPHVILPHTACLVIVVVVQVTCEFFLLFFLVSLTYGSAM